MKGRRLHSAVFTTFEFDPTFFEQEIIPSLLDIAFSHATSMRLVQLEDHLKNVPGGIAVFYDAQHVSPSDSGSSRLDIRRVPVRHTKGVFHPKIALLLVEDLEPDEGGHHARTLLVACLSANITRAGWWSNLEAGHIEEIREGDKTSLKVDLLPFIAILLDAVRDRNLPQPELEGIKKFLGRTEKRTHRSVEGRLLPQFYGGHSSVVDFLADRAGEALNGCYLEVISPYFDKAPTCKVLQALVDRFAPREVRVFLPRNDSGENLCRDDFHASVSEIANVYWSVLPADALSMGGGERTKKRFVHAKVYRFFSRNPSREIVFVGSANLTTPAHERGNIECGLLIEVEAPKRPDFWLTRDSAARNAFAQSIEDGLEADLDAYCPLDVRFDWRSRKGELYWDSRLPSPPLKLQANGVLLGEMPSLPSKQWVALGEAISLALKECLERSSLLEVARPDKPVAHVLVQEEGMWGKPSLLKSLSTADILKYWSLLTAEQRAAFIAERSAEIKSLGLGNDLVIPLAKIIDRDTVFDRFAGIFHAFGCLERDVAKSLREGQEKIADYRIFGVRYDSLGSLLARIEAEAGEADRDAERYVMLLCAKQMCRELKHEFRDYWASRSKEAAQLESQIDRLDSLRQRVIEAGSADDTEFPAFLTWFDQWFLKRARGPATVAP
ncbi:hypothetical protein BWI17_19250 [Betaproteobacteria bacterium GR16-43]|nr:hypothetical protein BWI17_19250 [Betaproteobacteria bacterium GR16-43]